MYKIKDKYKVTIGLQVVASDIQKNMIRYEKINFVLTITYASQC